MYFLRAHTLLQHAEHKQAGAWPCCRSAARAAAGAAAARGWRTGQTARRRAPPAAPRPCSSGRTARGARTPPGSQSGPAGQTHRRRVSRGGWERVIPRSRTPAPAVCTRGDNLQAVREGFTRSSESTRWLPTLDSHLERLPKSRTSGHTRSTGAGSTPDTVTVTCARELMPGAQMGRPTALLPAPRTSVLATHRLGSISRPNTGWPAGCHTASGTGIKLNSDVTSPMCCSRGSGHSRS